MLGHGLIHNTTVTSEDITRETDVYGPEVGSLKGKTVRATPDPVRIPVLVPIPDDIKERHRNITLCADVCHVDGVRFLTNTSRNLHIGTIEFLSRFLLQLDPVQQLDFHQYTKVVRRDRERVCSKRVVIRTPLS